MIDSNKIHLLGDRVLLEMQPPEVSALIQLTDGLPSSTFKVLSAGPDVSYGVNPGEVVLVDYRDGFYLDGDTAEAGCRIIVRESQILAFRTPGELFPFIPADGYLLGNFDEERTERNGIIMPGRMIETPEKVNDCVKFISHGGYTCWVRRGSVWFIRYALPEGLYEAALVLRSDVLLEEVLDDPQ